MKGKLQVQL